ncbi:hypothetical protein FF1_022047 [Malus domestica]
MYRSWRCSERRLCDHLQRMKKILGASEAVAEPTNKLKRTCLLNHMLDMEKVMSHFQHYHHRGHLQSKARFVKQEVGFMRIATQMPQYLT